MRGRGQCWGVLIGGGDDWLVCEVADWRCGCYWMDVGGWAALWWSVVLRLQEAHYVGGIWYCWWRWKIRCFGRGRWVPWVGLLGGGIGLIAMVMAVGS